VLIYLAWSEKPQQDISRNCEQKERSPKEYFLSEFGNLEISWVHHVLALSCVTALAILSSHPHNASMARPGRKPQTLDINQLAAAITEIATGEPVGPEKEPEPAKDPAAVALGRKGGLKGGPARAKKLGKKKLREAARKAARARWKVED
jgi:hypothetical protein